MKPFSMRMGDRMAQWVRACKVMGAGGCMAVWALQGAMAVEPPGLKTVAEISKYESTSLYADVVSFCNDLVKESKRARKSAIGQSREGRELPLLILSDPPIATPQEAVRAGKPVVLAFANIHAGEVDGKEAVLMLSRDLCLSEKSAILKSVIVLIVPILNADGNERIDKKHRTEQIGPVNGVGIRENADGYDLNRDFVKLETPEIQALVKAIDLWNPEIIVDLHTTNGSYHRFPMTFDIPRHPNADNDLILSVRNQWMPEIGNSLMAATGFPMFYYGNFNRDRSAWETVPPVPRFGVQYFALRNRVGILSESYNYDSFEKRVAASYGFLKSIMEYAAAHPQEVRASVAKAAPLRDRIELRTKQLPLAGEFKILGYVEETKNGRRKPTSELKEYPVKAIQAAETALTVKRPYAYLFPARYAKAAANLKNHGISVETIAADTPLEVEISRLDSLKRDANPFQKHKAVQLEVTSRKEKRNIAEGTIFVTTEQPLGNLIGFLLEPQSEDGLFTWNFFDEGLKEGSDVPVMRLSLKAELKKVPLK